MDEETNGTAATSEPEAPPAAPADSSLEAPSGPDPEPMALIKKARDRVATKAWRLEEAKSDAKLAKEEYDGAVMNLLRVIDEENRPLPLFDQGPKFDAPADPFNEDPPANDSWRGHRIADLCGLGLPVAVAGKLSDAGITTVGELAGHTADGGQLTDIKGVGEKAATQIADALEKFWAGLEAEGAPKVPGTPIDGTNPED